MPTLCITPQFKYMTLIYRYTVPLVWIVLYACIALALNCIVLHCMALQGSSTWHFISLHYISIVLAWSCNSPYLDLGTFLCWVFRAQLDPSIYESLQKEKVEVGDVIYIEANSGAVKVLFIFRNS